MGMGMVTAAGLAGVGTIFYATWALLTSRFERILQR